MAFKFIFYALLLFTSQGLVEAQGKKTFLKRVTYLLLYLRDNNLKIW